MEISTHDRLRAFLDRNKSRASGIIPPKIEAQPPQDPNTIEKSDNTVPLNESIQLSSSTPLIPPKDLASPSRTTKTPNLFSPGPEAKAEESIPTQQETPKKENFSNSPAPKEKKRLITAGDSPAKLIPRATVQNGRTSYRKEVDGGRKNYSSSPVKESSGLSQNFIENFVMNKKKTENKLQSSVRSVSREPNKPLFSLKNNGQALSYKSSGSKLKSRTPSTGALDPQTPLSARKLLQKKIGTRELSQSEKKPSTSERVKKSQKLANSTVFSSGVKKPKEENHEFVFEESQPVNKVNRDSRATRATREISKTKEVSRSRTPKKAERQQQPKQELPQQQTPQQEKPTKSPRGVVNTKNDEFFPESSKRLQALDAATNSEAKFKNEIKKLIQIIKQEKEEINGNLETMAKELHKYKSAYKKLKKQMKEKEKEESLLKAKASIGKIEENMNILTPIETNIPIETNPDMNFSLQNVNSGRNSISQNEAKTEEKKADENKKQEVYVPFTIEELQKHLDSNIPPTNEEEDHIELISRMNNINSDVENIIMKATQDFKESTLSLHIETHSFQLRKNTINIYIVKEMNLSPHLFFQDTIKESEEEKEFKPTVIDLLAAQREIIHYLIRKLEIEEKQRLKTEEQASKMMVQMERSLKQVEEKSSGSRKIKSASTTELNKSVASQV